MRAWRDGDEERLGGLLGPGDGDLYRQGHGLLGPDRDGPRWRRTRLVEEAGAVVGAVAVVRNRLHTQRYVLAVEVAPAHRRRGLGRRLVEEARRVRPEPLPFMVKVLDADPAATGLVAAVGGRPFLRCPTPRLTPDTAGPWAERQATPPGIALRPMTDVPVAEVARAWFDQYVWVHERFAPVTDEAALREVAAAVAAGTDRAASVGAWAGDRLVAYALVEEERWDGARMVATETVAEHEPAGERVVAAVLAEAARRLFAAGETAVMVDGHDTDEHLPAVVRSLPATIARVEMSLAEVP
jgi:GNAT superfamily N-acetyltransferase